MALNDSVKRPKIANFSLNFETVTSFFMLIA